MSTYRHPGTVLTEHVFSVPLDHSRPGGERIEVFGREVVAAGSDGDSLPWLLFLQGGPGMPATRAVGRKWWLDRALRDYRVLLLDQRGTGRSTPVSAGSAIPIFGTLNQTPPHRIAMNVLQFLDELPFRPDVEVIVACLPEGVFLPQRQPSRDSLFQ